MVTHTEVLTLEFPDRAHVPEEGQNIHGLYIEGAKWNRQEGRLEDSEPKKLQLLMPVIYVTAVEIKVLKQNNPASGLYPPLNAAVYKYPRRNDRYLIFRLFLRSGEYHPHHWKLRGVCLVAQVE